MAPPAPEDAASPTQGGDDNSEKKSDTKEETPMKLPPMPPMPNFTGRSGDPLYDTLSSAVRYTNAALAQVEEKTDVVSTTVLSRLRSVGNQASHSFRDAFVLYERRGQYGPQIVAGSAVAFGGLVGLRRGKIPGFVVGSLAGCGTYANIYGIESFGLGKKFE